MTTSATRGVGASILLGLCACGDSGTSPQMESPEQGAIADENAEPCEVPSEPSALLAYLRGGAYKDFARESAPHASSGPHGGRVLTYVNDLLAESLDAGETEHPRCAASVKELFLGGNEVRGWAVLVKTEAESRDGRGYYWLEVTRTDATRAEYQGQGIGICVGCHSDGHDSVLTPWPLQ